MNAPLPDQLPRVLPPPPPFRLPRPRRRSGGVVASVVLHALILLSLVRFGVDWINGAGDARGPRGGGGGGAGASTRYVELPALTAPPPSQVTAPAPVVTAPPPDPVPVESETAVPDVPVVAPASLPIPAAPTAGTGTGGGAGQGPGTGGGAGAGTGGGVGTDSGPGRGGSGDYITPPYARTVLLPADCARGRFTVRFWIEADGTVSRVVVEPPPKDARCRREMQEKMQGYQFLPARTRDGRAVPAVTEVHLQH
ncbi:MAG TPA: hypothetical protein VLB49_11340 [Gemmatimonadales bacterium]|nr:hypothetical protein [Gemmatimonadales bacterium]